MVPDPSKTSLGLEYFVNEGDDLWCMADADLAELGTRECEALGLISAEEVVDWTVIRMPKAYPVYDQEYGERVQVLQDYLSTFRNLQTIGRNGQHRYNNQDHSMLAGIFAARNVMGADYDVWQVNVEQEYHEEGSRQAPDVQRADTQAMGDRLTPRRAEPRPVQDLIQAAFARYDPVALGTAVGTVAAAVILFVTLVPLLRGDPGLGTTVSLLGYYFFGYEVSWRGLAVGVLEAAGGGFLFGMVLAAAINHMVARHEAALHRRIEAEGLLDILASTSTTERSSP